MFNTIRIMDLRITNGRYFWDVLSTDDCGDASRDTYHTNKGGEGIFAVQHDGTSKQITGFCQFNLNGVTHATRLRRIRAMFADD